MIVFADKEKEPKEAKSFWASLGRNVISKSGENSGRLVDLCFLSGNLSGIVVLKGFRKIYFSREHLKTDSKERILLKIDPPSNLLGKRVYDKNARFLGSVTEIQVSPGTVKLIRFWVRKFPFTPKLEFYPEDIQTSIKNVLLKKDHAKRR
ncbi:hypothetical protein [Leptospira kmetyi]|uniref:PRC-barrel domain-containing protein n=1 Tax=Leptospira kmetyi TaxID=408139 RepID=A0A2M9XPU1_9LEPT|nr:hypothetical protein [Leptospira kmetyi]AYV55461.1 hypothetical protein EFP84_08015 [Leptospira kmetyi]EQA51806.1 hypothetical protein LEP1GSC052_2962 [Leptospira kmetyi serovar Malaysia str. Bejo-Iso9]PJZ27911.1 hypothetical protein CH378_20525 [Leptospira kmetyi]PJZ41268.1 hypothetical protein CH370_10675 [Leptospira kmetyi]TGK16740.1 hypothetical protein EHO62_13570 [Leptospira kmetyi]